MLISIQVSEMHGTERVKFSSCAKKKLHMGKYLFKVNNKDTWTTSMDSLRDRSNSMLNGKREERGGSTKKVKKSDMEEGV